MTHPYILPHHHEDDAGKLIGHIPKTEQIAGVAEAMKQLGDPSRLQIFWVLCHCEQCVTNLAALVDMSAPAVSHHLRILKASGLVESRREGKEMHYRAADTPLVGVLHRSMEEILHIQCPDVGGISISGDGKSNTLPQSSGACPQAVRPGKRGI